jgi:hypothetical protein
MNGLELHERMVVLMDRAEKRFSKKKLALYWVQELVIPKLAYRDPEEALTEAAKAIEERKP